MSSPFALSVYSESGEDQEVQLAAGTTRYFTGDDPLGSLLTGKVPPQPLGHFAVKGDKLFIHVEREAGRGRVRLNGRTVVGTGQVDYGDEIDIGETRLLVVMANLPPLQLGAEFADLSVEDQRAKHESSVELKVINPALGEAAGAVADEVSADSGVPATTDGTAGPTPHAAPVDSQSQLEMVTFTGDLPHAAGTEDAARMFMRFEAREAENEALAEVLAEMGFLTLQQTSAIREKLRDYFLEHLKMPADLGTLLQKNGMLTREQLERALDRMRQRLTGPEPQDGEEELPEYVPEVDADAEARATGKFTSLNAHFLDLARGRGDIDADAERDLRLGVEDGRVWLGQVALDYAIIPPDALQELRRGQMVEAARAYAQRLWRLLSAQGSGADSNRLKECVREQVTRLKAGARADLFEILVEKRVVTTADVAGLRQQLAEMPAEDGELTVAAEQVPEPVRPPARYRAGNVVGREVLLGGGITPVQYARLRRLQDGLRISGHRRSMFDLIRAKQMLSAERIRELEVGYRSQVAQWEDEELADTLVRLQVIPLTDRDDLLARAERQRHEAIRERDPHALHVRLGLVMHELGRVPRGDDAARLLKAGVLNDYLSSLGDEMRYPSDKATMEWAAAKYRIPRRRQMELSVAHQEFCLMLHVPLITFLTDEGEVPADEADAWATNIWFRNLRTHEEKVFQTAVSAGLIEKPLARECLAKQAAVFTKKRTVTSAWQPWLRARIDNPTRPVLPSRQPKSKSTTTTRRRKPDGDGAPAPPPAPAPATATDPPAPADSPATEIRLDDERGIKAGRRDHTALLTRSGSDSANPLIDRSSTKPLEKSTRLEPAPPPLAKAPPAVSGSSGRPLAPAPPAAADPAQLAAVQPPSPDVPRKNLIEEWQALKAKLKTVSGDERERGRLREHDLRLMLESLAPADAMALVLMRQKQVAKLGLPDRCRWPQAEIERRFKEARREMEANWMAVEAGWLPEVFGDQEHLRTLPLIYRSGPFDSLLPPDTPFTPLIYPPALWMVADEEAVNFGSAPRLTMLGLDPRACRVDPPPTANLTHSLTIGFQPEERGGGYRSRPRARLLEVTLGPRPDEKHPARALGQFMATLLDIRKRYVDAVYREQAKQPLSEDVVHFFLGRLGKLRTADPAQRARQCKTLLQQLLKEAIFAIHPVEVRDGGLNEFLKVAERVKLVPDLAKQVVQASRLKPSQAATELDKAVRTTLTAVTPSGLHRRIFDPQAKVPAVNELPKPDVWTGIIGPADDPFVAAVRYWRNHPVPFKPKA